MGELRDGKLPDKANANTNNGLNSSSSAAPKRKASHISNDKENSYQDRPQTPPDQTPAAKSIKTEDKASIEPNPNPSTPGRVGPIRRPPHDKEFASPNIKPFKGEPGRKVRKTPAEKKQEYDQWILENPDYCFHELYVCYHKGPNGSPTYDKEGFELDYGKVAEWMRPKAYNKKRMVDGMSRHLERREREDNEMALLFFGEPASQGAKHHSDHWKDRVSKDLGVPWHRIDIEHFREWRTRGFGVAKQSDYIDIPEEQRKRIANLHSGCNLRK